jgi:tRNA dimethylallyltransferase
MVSLSVENHRFRNEPFNALKIGLHKDREKLYERIDQRVDLMIQAGLVEEVKKLLAMGYSAELKSMQSIGYRHVVGFLKGNLPWAECLRTLKRDTRRFAKRQFTWFGADPQIKWYQPEQLDQIFEAVERFLD